MTSSMLKSALKYAENAWAVFPCNGKRPYTENGFKAATTDPVQIEAWWTEFPDANIGFVPGSAGLLVIDVDGATGDETAGELSLLAEPTFTVETGRGYHRFYKHPGGTIGNVDIGAGLDVRADRGYVLLPPSLHPSGKRYTIDPSTKGIYAILPPAVIELLLKQNGNGNGTGNKEPAGPLPEVIPEGERENHLVSLAGTMRRRGLTESDILDAITAANERCEPPLEHKDLERIARSVGRYEPAKNLLSLSDPMNGDEKKRKRPVLFADLMALPEEPTEWEVQGLAARKALSMLCGKPKSGKSTFMVELAIRKAFGGAHVGCQMKPAPVLWWNLEQPPARTRQQFRQMARRLGVDEEDLPLHILAERDRAFDWQTYCLENGIRLVILDSLAKWWQIEDVKDSTQTERAMETLRQGAEQCDLALWSIYHERKSGGDYGEGILGSTQILAQLDYAITMARVGGHLTRRTLKTVGRDEDTPPDLVVDFVDGCYELLGTGRDVAGRDCETTVFNILIPLGPNQTVRDVRTAAKDTEENPSPATINRGLKGLTDKGLVVKTGRGVSGDPFKYTVAEP